MPQEDLLGGYMKRPGDCSKCACLRCSELKVAIECKCIDGKQNCEECTKGLKESVKRPRM